MLFTKKMNLVGFLNLLHIAVLGLNHLTKFCKLISPNLVQVKPLNKSAAGLNHFLEWYWLSTIAIIIYRHWPFFWIEPKITRFKF